MQAAYPTVEENKLQVNAVSAGRSALWGASCRCANVSAVYKHVNLSYDQTVDAAFDGNMLWTPREHSQISRLSQSEIHILHGTRLVWVFVFLDN